MFRIPAFAILALSVTGAAQAEEAGTLTLDIDGESYAYTLWAGQSDWSGSESYASTNIYTQPAEGGDESDYKTFTLGFEVIGGSASSAEARLTRLIDEERVRYFGNEDEDEGGMSITVDEMSTSGEELSVSGSFSGQMGTSENYGRDIDLEDGLSVSGTFDVTLGPVE